LAAAGQLAGGIAHDFNNMLTGVMLYAQMPLRKGKPDLPPNARRAFENILTESRRAVGLAQVDGIVAQHGGHIGVETELGRGTTFHIYLPAYEVQEEVAEEEQVSAIPQGQGETILLVEDNEYLREGGRELLESLGYRVLTGANGREALEVYQTAQGVDMVITDLVMPKIGGKELVSELGKINPALKALAITGYIVDKDTQGLKKEGFLDVVYKPFEVDQLARVIRRALDVD